MEANFREPDKREIEQFKNDYCRNDYDRRRIIDDFDVTIESWEDVIFNKNKKSYATGEKIISDSFVIFKVRGKINNIEFTPVFSESTARKMIHNTQLTLPKKVTVFQSLNQSNNTTYTASITRNTNSPCNPEVKEFIELIILSRYLMTRNIEDPKPMNGVFKELYDNCISDPSQTIQPFNIKKVNTALEKYFQKDTEFRNLDDFISTLNKGNIPAGKKLKTFDFGIIRDKLKARYENIKIYF